MGHVAIFTPELSWYKRITNGGSDSKGEEFGNKITDLQRFQEVQNNQLIKSSLILFLLISTMHVFCCHPIPSSKVSGKSDCFVILLNSCPMRMDRREGLDFLKPVLEKTLMKRSFRNGVGTGMRNTSFQRAKS
ncbi:LOW QUALITY PROTEIN: neuropeptide S [Globicephala melas]|uniref:LOW QUALITY PROTEIN: neuropeptide S n=1 Tax=Globicephala melas TaxID=9731 RepID=UPI00293D280A|nr:LOW QUALITY PROTEIN: neuropeptide S [Globicephala melas]